MNTNIECNDEFCNGSFDCEKCKECKYSYKSKHCLYCEDIVNCENCYGLSHKKDLKNVVSLHEKSTDPNDYKCYKLLEPFDVTTLFDKSNDERTSILKSLNKTLFTENTNCINTIDSIECVGCEDCNNCYKCRDSNQCVGCVRCENCYKCYGLGGKLRLSFCKKNIVVYYGQKYKDLIDYPDYTSLNNEIIEKYINEGKFVNYEKYLSGDYDKITKTYINSDKLPNFNPETGCSDCINVDNCTWCDRCKDCIDCSRCKDCYGLHFPRHNDIERIIEFNKCYYEDTSKELDMLSLNDTIIEELIKKNVIKLIRYKYSGIQFV